MTKTGHRSKEPGALTWDVKSMEAPLRVSILTEKSKIGSFISEYQNRRREGGGLAPQRNTCTKTATTKHKMATMPLLLGAGRLYPNGTSCTVAQFSSRHVRAALPPLLFRAAFFNGCTTTSCQSGCFTWPLFHRIHWSLLRKLCVKLWLAGQLPWTADSNCSCLCRSGSPSLCSVREIVGIPQGCPGKS